MDNGVQNIVVTRTYLQLAAPAALRSAPASDGRLQVERLAACPAAFYRRLYREVGRRYHWVDRLEWTDADILAHLSQPGVSVWVMRQEDDVAGYFELCHHDDGSTEIAYIGLLPDYVGRGLGRRLLGAAVEAAQATGARRVWLHTCTLDHPAAMPLYLSCGFVPFKRETYTTTVSPEELADAGWQQAVQS